MTFTREHLDELDRLLATASAVVAMQDVHAGNHRPDVIGLRHDVDDNAHSLETAVIIAGWERAHGYRSTYFVLHTAGYWDDEHFLRAQLEQIAVHGHEIGIHTNAIAESLRTGHDPQDILYDAIEQLRGWGFPVLGVAPHGDELCRRAGFVNDEQFVECARPEMGSPTRTLTHRGRELPLAPLPLATFGLEYETYRLPKGRYLSDSGGEWQPAVWPTGDGQLHILQHPDWWSQAFVREAVAA